MASDEFGSRFNPLAGLGHIPWAEFFTPLPDEPSLPDILTGLASSDPSDVDDAWFALDESQCLLHQGTVYPATTYAAPFLVRLAACADTVRQADLAALVCMLAAGDDQPHASAGTATAVRHAIRANLHEFRPSLETNDMSLGVAVVMLATSFPGDLAGALDLAARLRENARGADLDVLTAVSCVLGEPTDADLAYLAERERQSTTTAVVRDGLTIYPETGSTDERTPIVELPIHHDLMRWFAEGRPGYSSQTTVQLARTISHLHSAFG